jgi:N-acetylglucosamine-6-sulfatase
MIVIALAGAAGSADRVGGVLRISRLAGAESHARDSGVAGQAGAQLRRARRITTQGTRLPPLAAALAMFGLLMPALASAKPPPNVIVIQTDDQNVSDLSSKVMPRTESFLVEHGTSFTNYSVATPQCCPSRASLLTGQYPHNDGVASNDDGYPALAGKDNTLPVWLTEAGYATAHVGKYMNGYTSFTSLKDPAPGWRTWFTVGEGTRYYDYDAGVDGKLVHFRSRPADYVTRVLNHEAVSFVRRKAARTTPFYLQLDERAPHDAQGGEVRGPCDRYAIPDPRDEDRFRHAKLPRSPSFNERNMSDKPPFIASLPRLTRHAIDKIRQSRRCRLASLAAVDRGVGNIRDALKKAGALGRTVLLFTSDNGFFEGEHRLPRGKVLPYREALHQPLAIRVPKAYRSGPRVPKLREPVSNIDLAPTILDLAGADPCNAAAQCRTMDGRSLAGLLDGDDSAWPAHRGLLFEYHGGSETAPRISGVCRYRGVNQSRYSYTEYTSLLASHGTTCEPSDERELYSFADDPFQLENLYPASPGSPAALEQDALQVELAQLRDCAGIAGRDPLPPSGHYCG